MHSSQATPARRKHRLKHVFDEPLKRPSNVVTGFGRAIDAPDSARVTILQISDLLENSNYLNRFVHRFDFKMSDVAFASEECLNHRGPGGWGGKKTKTPTPTPMQKKKQKNPQTTH